MLELVVWRASANESADRAVAVVQAVALVQLAVAVQGRDQELPLPLLLLLVKKLEKLVMCLAQKLEPDLDLDLLAHGDAQDHGCDYDRDLSHARNSLLLGP